MIKLKIGEQVHNLPSDWNEVTLDQFKRLARMGELTPIRTMIERLKILATLEITDEIMGQFDMSSMNEIIEKMSFVTVAPDKKMGKQFNIKDRKFSMLQDLSDLTVGEWADLEHFISKAGDNIINELEYILAIICRPLLKETNEYGKNKWEIEKYESKSLESRAEYFLEKMPADYAMSCMGFFLTLEVRSIKRSLKSLMKDPKMKKLMKIPLTEKNREKLITGFHSFTH